MIFPAFMPNDSMASTRVAATLSIRTPVSLYTSEPAAAASMFMASRPATEEPVSLCCRDGTMFGAPLPASSVSHSRSPSDRDSVRPEPGQLGSELVGADVDDAVERARLPVGGVHVLVERREVERAAKPWRRSRIDARCCGGRTVVERADIHEVRRIGPKVR